MIAVMKLKVNRVNALTQAAGLTQTELAEKLGMTQSQVSDIARGRNCPTLKTAYRLSRALNAPIEYVFPDMEAR